MIFRLEFLVVPHGFMMVDLLLLLYVSCVHSKSTHLLIVFIEVMMPLKFVRSVIGVITLLRHVSIEIRSRRIILPTWL